MLSEYNCETEGKNDYFLPRNKDDSNFDYTKKNIRAVEIYIDDPILTTKLYWKIVNNFRKNIKSIK